MRSKRIAIYGGMALDDRAIEFVRALSEALLDYPDVAIVTGGFHYSLDDAEATSTDRAAFQGALRYATVTGAPLAELFQTWIPEPGRDRQGIVRFKEGLVRELKGKSAQARRLALVEQVDALVTIKGDQPTALVLDMAFAVDKPALPTPFTGGASRAYWNDNREQIVAAFQLSPELAQRIEVGTEDLMLLARNLAEAVWRVSSHVCLVLSPFRPEADAFQSAVLNPAIESAGFRPLRLDRTPDAGNIASMFLNRLRQSDAVIADVTEGSPNVLYELGQAHARGIEPLLVARRPLGDELWKVLPFYLYQQRVAAYDSSTEAGRTALSGQVREFLANHQKVSKGGMVPPLSSSR